MRSSFDARTLDYELPEDRIAQKPLAARDAARLLCMPRGEGALTHRQVRDLPDLLEPSLIVLNDTRVIPARLFGHKPTGGRVEILLLERLDAAPGQSLVDAPERWSAFGRASKGLQPGEVIALGDGVLSARIAGREGMTLEVELTPARGMTVTEGIARIGRMPLPPYIARDARPEDDERYQTVFAANAGAVAAPTAGLHFTPELLAALRERGHELAYVTLHVGPGTFAPLRADDLSEHVMHAERYVVPEETVAAIARARAEGRQVLAIGTTVVRTLESAVQPDGSVRAGEGTTSIFIYPPYAFRVIDALMTNFHLPRSTLLALVMAFAGIEPARAAYQTAIEQSYRFYSYGDAMLIGGQL